MEEFLLNKIEHSICTLLYWYFVLFTMKWIPFLHSKPFYKLYNRTFRSMLWHFLIDAQNVDMISQCHNIALRVIRIISRGQKPHISGTLLTLITSKKKTKKSHVRQQDNILVIPHPTNYFHILEPEHP